jgi:hypothetical protein
MENQVMPMQSPAPGCGVSGESSITQDQIIRFATLFRGCQSAFGTYDLSEPQRDDRGKLKGVARTVRKSLSQEQWKAHLEGRAALGVIPIDENNLARFGVIDVDRYTVDHAEVASRIERMDLPLIVARSKSGGMHIFLFASEPIPAAAMIERLKAISAMLGYASSEAFPKQPAVNWANGDVGSWINLAYFDARRTMRFAVDAKDNPLTLEEFLDRAETLRQSPQWFKEPLAVSADELKGAPPCLQTLVNIGIGPGQRNNTALALGVYLKRSRPDDWQTGLEQVNQQYFSPPLPSDEISNVIRSLRKRNYCYACKTEPLASHCDRRVCLTREFGIGDGSANVVLSHIRILETNPPIYFISVEGFTEPLEIDLDCLWDHARFQKACMERLRIYPAPKKRPDWAAEVTALLQKADTIPAPPDASDQSRSRFEIEKFLSGRVQAGTRDEISLGKPWHNDEDNRYYFRASDLQSHLERNRVPMRGNQLWAVLRKMGAESHEGWRVRGLATNLWSLPAPECSNEPLPIPPDLAGERSF